MQRVRRMFGAVAVLALVAGPVAAQGHEMGVDLVIASTKLDIDGADRVLEVGTPVDVRIGFGGAPLSFETRFSFGYVSSDGNSILSFDPGLNLLYSLSGSRQEGLYLTGGGKIDIARVSGDDDSETETQIGVNVGVGTRMPMGSAALRIEGFYMMMLEKGSLGDSDYAPGANAIGVRIGWSFWK